MNGERIEVRATVTLVHLGVGQIGWVDPTNEYTRMLLDTGKLIPTKTVWPPVEEAAE